MWSGGRSRLITRRLIIPHGRRDQARLVLTRMDQDFRL
jgi:hypothetical protein